MKDSENTSEHIPCHLAIIMDGNGRWAQARHLPRIVGHQKGVETVRQIVEECTSLGIRYLTLYAFSSENWGRPSEEVSALMGLLSSYLKSELQSLLTNRVRLNVIGEIEKLPKNIRRTLVDSVERTRNNEGMTLTLALSYGSRDELVRACRKIALRIEKGELGSADINEKMIESELDTRDLPEPDLLVRTSGEMRISNFLLWQIAYTELYFTEVYWPDFNRDELHKAIKVFGQRQRRFGLTSEQTDPVKSTEGESY
ncbi:MAG: isoprenyl transferase [Desulfuromonas sp.]|nr:MAG: isoprenyl transferase [Desulfuromonas sp.]